MQPALMRGRGVVWLGTWAWSQTDQGQILALPFTGSVALGKLTSLILSFPICEVGNACMTGLLRGLTEMPMSA